MPSNPPITPQDSDDFRILESKDEADSLDPKPHSFLPGFRRMLEHPSAQVKTKCPASYRISLAAGVAALALLAVLIAMSPARLTYDEPDHLRLAQHVEEIGWPAALNSLDNHCATGPLQPAAQVAASPLTLLQAPAVRWVNFVFLIVVIITLAGSSGSNSVQRAWLTGLSILAVPFFWPTVGLALTELPALAAFSVFVLAMRRILTHPGSPTSTPALSWACVAGVSLGTAILGRQTYLVVIPAVVALFAISPRNWSAWLLCLVLAGFTCGWLFVFWGGMVPSNVAYINNNIRLDHGVLALSYVAAATLFLRPGWVYPKNRLTLVASLVLGLILAFATRHYSNPPSISLMTKICGEPLALFVGFSIGMLMTAAGVLWLWNTLQAAWAERFNPWRAFLFLTLFALLAAPMKITHLFSSRYVVGLLGVLILYIDMAHVSEKLLPFRLSLGTALGAASLWMYYS